MYVNLFVCHCVTMYLYLMCYSFTGGPEMSHIIENFTTILHRNVFFFVTTMYHTAHVAGFHNLIYSGPVVHYE